MLNHLAQSQRTDVFESHLTAGGCRSRVARARQSRICQKDARLPSDSIARSRIAVTMSMPSCKPPNLTPPMTTPWSPSGRRPTRRPLPMMPAPTRLLHPSNSIVWWIVRNTNWSEFLVRFPPAWPLSRWPAQVTWPDKIFLPDFPHSSRRHFGGGYPRQVRCGCRTYSSLKLSYCE